MALRDYVLSKYMSGTSKDEVQLDITQLKDRGSYAIPDAKALIAYDIFAALENLIDPHYTEGSIYKLFESDGKYRLRVFDGIQQNVKFTVIITVDNKQRKYAYDVRGKVLVRQVYSVVSIDDADVRYIVPEHIVHPRRGVSLVKRCYHPYFQDLLKAERYQSLKMVKYDTAQGNQASGYRLFVVDVNEIQNSQWYKDNMEAARMLKEYKLDAEKYRYMENASDVFMAIKADAYEYMQPSDRKEVDTEIYNIVRDYVDEDELPFLDEAFDGADADTTADITNQAIAMALAAAEDEESFKKIHDVLGFNEYRIGCLTDDIYNANPDTGYILASKTGELQWYLDCYCIGQWDKAKGNPYFGKFQKNENDTLLSFREFHPELFVDDFPTKEEIAEWEKKFLQQAVKERALHKEMYHDEDMIGEDVVYGTWYYAGLESRNFFDGICFHTRYGTHTFTDDECRRLLSGEELVVEKFITKTDIETTIRGRLQDCSGLYDEDKVVEFVRTDINVSSRRRQIDAELGIEEPNLPPPPT